MVRFGNIQIYYEGHSEDMGIHIHMGGQACREYEEYQVRTWAQLFALIFEQGHFTRIDIAIDDFKGYFKISAIERKIKTGQLSSKFKKRGIWSPQKSRREVIRADDLLWF